MASSECCLLSALEATVTQLRTRLVFEKTLCILEIGDWALFCYLKMKMGLLVCQRICSVAGVVCGLK